MPTTHNLNCARLRPHREGENAYPCSCGAAAPDVHNHGPYEGPGPHGLCHEYSTPEGHLRGSCLDVPTPDEPPKGDPPLDSAVPADLATWWRERGEAEAEAVVPKATEYGGAHRASDLIQLGRTIAELINPDYVSGHVEYTDGQLQELACYFYIQGKLGRWHAALLEGRQVSDDTLHDVAVYVKMVQRIRDVGGWPV